MTATHTFVERPILFRGDMVRAILEGRKTQTRRALKPQPQCDTKEVLHGDGATWLLYQKQKYGQDSEVRCPYGAAGDRLWVRETFYCDDFRFPDGPVEEMKKLLYYRADPGVLDSFEAETPIWRPSIFMPRWASRISLEITRVRVERLDDIVSMDAIAEGVSPLEALPRLEFMRFFREFRKIPQDVNPWLWVIDFRRIP